MAAATISHPVYVLAKVTGSFGRVYNYTWWNHADSITFCPLARKCNLRFDTNKMNLIKMNGFLHHDHLLGERNLWKSIFKSNCNGWREKKKHNHNWSLLNRCEKKFKKINKSWLSPSYFWITHKQLKIKVASRLLLSLDLRTHPQKDPCTQGKLRVLVHCPQPPDSSLAGTKRSKKTVYYMI